MEQHPVPQQISSYQFRLVGDMTLKQFFRLAGGAVVSLIFYSSPLHPLIKWPAVFFFALLGVALAFLPFEDRPLEAWIIAFFRSIYSPTIYSWKKLQNPPQFFRDEAAVPQQVASGVEPGIEGEKLETYLAETESQKPAFARALETYEKTFLSGVSSLFGASVAPNQEAQIPEAPVIKAVSPETISPLTSRRLSATQAAEFSPLAAPPAPPTVANTVSGQVLDAEGKIVEAAILEIRDAAGRPVRALKTNKLGHFMVVTPLQNGPYEVITEKDGYEFEPLSLETTGELIPPIVVRAKGARQN